VNFAVEFQRVALGKNRNSEMLSQGSEGSLGHVRRSLDWIHPADTIGIAAVELGLRRGSQSSDDPSYLRQDDLALNGLYLVLTSTNQPRSHSSWMRELIRSRLMR